MAETTLAAPAPDAPRAEWTKDQKELIKRTVARDATDDELAMFLHVARTSGLDPLRKQIYFVKRRYQDKRTGKWVDTVSIQAGIDGMQARAAREADYDGTLAGVVYEKDSFVYDKAKNLVSKHEGNPFQQGLILGAWATTFRRGKEPFTAIVKMASFRDDRSNFWTRMPEVMIEKVARATSLRRAYPEQLGHVYEPSEMGRSSLESLPSEEEQTSLPSEAPPEELPPPEEGPSPGQPASEEPAEPQTPAAPAARGGQADLAGRRQLAWAKAKALGMSDIAFKAWVQQVLGHGKPSKEWTAEDLGKVEKALKEDASSLKDVADPDEGPTS